MKVQDFPCPLCQSELYLSFAFVAARIGEHSLAGCQIKVSAQAQPRLRCHGCDLDLPGRFDDDAHVVFDLDE